MRLRRENRGAAIFLFARPTPTSWKKLFAQESAGEYDGLIEI
jgi:hypothetical protein